MVLKSSLVRQELIGVRGDPGQSVHGAPPTVQCKRKRHCEDC